MKTNWCGTLKRVESSLLKLHIMPREHTMTLLPSPSNPSNQKFWKLIWNAPILARQMNFLWRVAKGILPTRGNLLRKGMSLDPAFPFCSSGIEIVQHIFMECVFVKQVLFASFICYRIPPCLGVNQWIQSVLDYGDSQSSQLICACL